MTRARDLTLRLMRVPPEPEIPEGNVIRVFRASPRYLRYRKVVWAILQIGVLVGLLVFAIILYGAREAQPDRTIQALIYIGFGLGMAVYSAQLVVSYAVLRLDYDMRWYILMDSSLRIREGILNVREKTMTFANVQHITIDRNPLQRWLGLADVHVRTAGGGGAAGSSASALEGMHEAYFRGVENAEEIRDAIRERVRILKDDRFSAPAPADVMPTPSSNTGAAAVVTAAKELLAELRAWRAEVGAPII